MKVICFLKFLLYLFFLSLFSNIYSSDFSLKDDGGYRLKNWNFYIQSLENSAYTLGLEKK